MNFFADLFRRRVPHYVSAYFVGGFGLVQFIEFLEGRMQLSPHWVNLVAIGLLLLIPSVVLLAWTQGRPGKDHWGRLEKTAIPGNLILAILILAVIFHGKDLGAVTTKVAVTDENGQISERVVPKSIYRKRIILYGFQNAGPAGQEWLRHGIPLMLNLDLSQDAFIEARPTTDLIPVLREAGYPEGLDEPRALQRKIARDSHFPFFMTGSVRSEGSTNIIATELHASDSGHLLAQREFQGPDIFALIDDISLQLRKDLDIPAGYIDKHIDVAVAEILSEDIDAVRIFTQAAMMAVAHNEWEAAVEQLTEAVKRDPTFAMAQNLLSISCMLLGRSAEATTAINAAMENIYRLPERVQLQIKASYYLNVKQDADKSMAVIDMWTQLYPQDVSAFLQKAYFYMLRNDRAASIAAYEEALKIDPHQYEVLLEIGRLYQDQGDFSQAEKYLLRYTESFPSSIPALTQLANLYMDVGELKRAAQTLERALLIEPGHIATRLSLADIAVKEGKFAEARELLAQLATEADTPQERFDVLGRQMLLCRLQGQIGAIFEYLDDYLDNARELYSPPEVNILRALRLQFLSEIGRAEEQLASIEALAERTPPPVNTMVAYFRCDALIELNRLDEAEEQIDEIEALVDQLKIEIWRSRIADAKGQLALARNDYDDAEKHFRHAIEVNPTSPRLQRRLGRVLRMEGKFDEAEQILRQLLKLDPGNGRTNFELAQLFNDTKDTVQAREYLRIAMVAWQDADPEYAPAIAARELQVTLGSLP